MKERVFLKYIVAYFAGLLLVFFLFGYFLSGYTAAYFSNESQQQLESAARSINRDITGMLEISKQDFQYLVEHFSHLLAASMDAQKGESEMEIFLTDHLGTLLISTERIEKGEISSAAMSQGTKMGREGKIFTSTLDSFYEEERIFYVVILEKEHSETNRQRVGAVYLSLPAETRSLLSRTLGTSLLFAIGLILVMSIFLFFSFYRSLVRPLQAVNTAAEAFARGDFSQRLSEKGGGEITPLIRAFNQMAEKVEKNENIRQTFVSNVSHDLRTPLTTIGGFVQNMMAGVVPSEEYGRYFKIVLDEVNRLSRLVQTLLETGRMTSGERKYTFAPLDVCELGRITLLSFENRLEEKELEVSFEAQEDSIYVMADSDAIQQVIYNLLDNATKFVPRKGSLSIHITRKEKKVFFAVENSGEGIPPEELSHLFDRFYKSDRSRGMDKTGMGLGLFIAKTIVSAHGEEIWVESAVGKFTRFVFSLPLTQGKGKNR